VTWSPSTSLIAPFASRFGRTAPHRNVSGAASGDCDDDDEGDDDDDASGDCEADGDEGDEAASGEAFDMPA
jgi:hypothetical protein